MFGRTRRGFSEERVIECLVKEAGVDRDRITPDATLVDDLDLDSLDVVELVMDLEDEFGIEISDEDSERVETVGDLVALVKRLSSEGAAR